MYINGQVDLVVCHFYRLISASQPTFKYAPNLQPHTIQSGLMSAHSTRFLLFVLSYLNWHTNSASRLWMNTKLPISWMSTPNSWKLKKLKSISTKHIIILSAIYNFYMETHIVAINISDTNFSAIPINSIGFAGYGNNWVPYVTDSASTTLFNETTVTFQYTYFMLKRTNISKSFVLIIFVINWGLTLMVVSIRMVTLFTKNQQIPNGIVVLPVSVTPTLSRLHALFMDSPPSCE